MSNCCEKHRFNYDSLKTNKVRNVRYKYIDLPPLVKGLRLDVNSLDTVHELVWYDLENVTIKIQKKGCHKSCEGDALTYTATVIQENNVYFIFDEEFYKLCRGRYEGIISVGCDEIPCRLDFKIGQRLCISNVTTEKKTDVNNNVILDASDLPDPNCCDTCEEVRPCGCFDATQQDLMCGNSIGGCEELEVNYQLNTAGDMIQKLDDWIAQQQTGPSLETQLDEFTSQV